MRQLIGEYLLLAPSAGPAELAAQRRSAAPRGLPSTPSFGCSSNWSSDVDSGSAAGRVPLQSLFPRRPLDGIVRRLLLPQRARRVSAHYWEINGNVAYRFTVPARSSFGRTRAAA